MANTSYSTVEGRKFGYYIPDSYDPSRPTPVLFMLHGLGGNSSTNSGGSAERNYYGWQETAEDNGFITIFPEAQGYFKTWSLASGGRSSDLEYVENLIDWADNNYNISESQVFTTGHSWGAYFSYYVAANLSERIAAFGSHSGGLTGQSWFGGTPEVSLATEDSPALNGIILHAKDDGVVPYRNSQRLYDDLLNNGHNVYQDGVGQDGIIEVDGWGPQNHRWRLSNNQEQWDFFISVAPNPAPAPEPRLTSFAEFGSASVIDGNGGSVEATNSFVVTPVNDTPIISGTKASFPSASEDSVVTLTTDTLLQGFSDPDGDTLSINNLTATNGTLTDNNDGSWTFSPNSNFSGTVSLSYAVIDGNGGNVRTTNSLQITESVPSIDLTPQPQPAAPSPSVGGAGGGGGTAAAPSSTATTNSIQSIENTVVNGRSYLSNGTEVLTNQANINIGLLGGNDFLEVTGGSNNFANGNNGEDHIVLRGGQGKYLGGNNNDKIEVFSSEAGSWVNGNNGTDFITGSVDGMIYRGGADADRLAVSAGTVWGDKGADTFQATGGAGVAMIQDYTAGLDLIQGVAGGSFSLTDQGLLYSLGDDQMLLLKGITDASQVTVI